MALTAFQRDVCRRLARTRVELGESYVAGGAALNEALAAARLSRDIDIFHDTEEALFTAWERDRRDLEGDGLSVTVLRERPSFVEAEVSSGAYSVVLQWVRDSAYRFFPLVTHPELGLTLHPFDLATNKVLALIGRAEVRDWVDTIECDRRLQPLGYLAWAACGKDPGFGPELVLEHAARSGRHSAEEVAALSFDGPPPDAAELSRGWHSMLERAREIVRRLPPDRAGCCVLAGDAHLCTAEPSELERLLSSGQLLFHEGRVRGAFPTLS